VASTAKCIQIMPRAWSYLVHAKKYLIGKGLKKTNNNSVELLGNAWAWAWAWANSLLTVVFDLINFTLQKFKSFSAIIGA
jgi:hypothetical protein